MTSNINTGSDDMEKALWWSKKIEETTWPLEKGDIMKIREFADRSNLGKEDSSLLIDLISGIAEACYYKACE